MVLAHNIDEVQRTEDIQICQDTTFETMMLSPDILNGLKSSGFIKPSPIQLSGIPLGKLGLDLLLEAKSGTGKTVVFSTIALEKLNLNKGLQVIIITPTREIAVQICDVLKQIGSECEGLTIEVVIGGLPLQDDIDRLKQNVHILVGTPGRLKYLIQDKHLETSAIRLFILDEADKLMEKSFQDDIKYIHSALPKQKQVIMSSATYPESVMDVINELVQDAHHVCPNSSNVLLGVSHKVTYVAHHTNSVRQTQIRFEELLRILTETQFKQCVIFCKYQARVSQLHKMLTKAKWPSELVYGKQDQTVRLDALKTLQEYKCRILIATDLVSRGIDAKNVDLVINFEPPDSCETYLHRIGRSGRYGSIGMAISIVSEGLECKNFQSMLEPIGNSINLQHFWTGAHFNNGMVEKKLGTETKNDLNNTAKEMVEEIVELKKTSINDVGGTNNELIHSYCNEQINEQKNNNYENLWNFIIADYKVTNKADIESFDQLCLSYKDLKNSVKIETFSDLLQSYQNIDDNNIKADCIEYKHMDFDNYSCLYHLNTVKNLKYKIESDNNCIKNVNQNIAANDIKMESIIRRKEENTHCNLNKPDHYNGKEYDNNHVPHRKNDNYIEANSFISQLPKAFHESTCKEKNKIQNNTKNHKILINEESLHVRNRTIKDQAKNRSLKRQTNKTISSEMKLGNACNYSTYSNHKQNKQYSDESNVKVINNNNLSDNLPCYKTFHSVDFGSFKSQHVYDNEYLTSRIISESYYQWYNQLKSNMKQIEQFLYINEMSKS